MTDSARWAKHFGAKRIIHRRDLDAAPEAEIVLEGDDPAGLAPGVVAIPTPGHTAGHAVLLVRDHFLFTGDHLWWSRPRGRLNASRSVCWDSWSDQARSMARLLGHRFEWILPGHGERANFPPEEMHRQVRELVERMAAG